MSRLIPLAYAKKMISRYQNRKKHPDDTEKDTKSIWFSKEVFEKLLDSDSSGIRIYLGKHLEY